MISTDAVHMARYPIMYVNTRHTATPQTEHLQQLKRLHHTRMATKKKKIPQDQRPYWTLKDDLAVIDGIIMKGRCIFIPEKVQK